MLPETDEAYGKASQRVANPIWRDDMDKLLSQEVLDWYYTGDEIPAKKWSKRIAELEQANKILRDKVTDRDVSIGLGLGKIERLEQENERLQKILDNQLSDDELIAEGMERAAEILYKKRCYSGAKIIRAEIEK